MFDAASPAGAPPAVLADGLSAILIWKSRAGEVEFALSRETRAAFDAPAHRSAAGAPARARRRRTKRRETTMTGKKYETVLIEKQDGE
jgi:hypothetical protein